MPCSLYAFALFGIKRKMKLVIDSKIPYIRGFAELLGDTVYLPGAEIGAADVRDADVLVIRTRTRCDEALLKGSNVRFIATATIGYDHLDTDYLRRAGIAWTNCPGCNARSVAQYVESALLLLNAHGCWRGDGALTPAAAPVKPADFDKSVFATLTLGIVGVGHVGRRVWECARRMGFGNILCCDPPRAEREGAAAFCTMEEIARRCDVITFHTPLTRAPQPHPTFHLASAEWFASLRRRPVLLNSGRGEVVDTAALKRALTDGTLRTAVIDTWENEPDIDRELLGRVFLGTPHIAGYSADGKANGTRMALQAVACRFGLDPAPFDAVQPPALPPQFCYYAANGAAACDEALRLYDPTRDSEALKQSPELFEKLRGDYPLRRENG